MSCMVYEGISTTADKCPNVAEYIYAGEIEVCAKHRDEIRKQGGGKCIRALNPPIVLITDSERLSAIRQLEFERLKLG